MTARGEAALPAPLPDKDPTADSLIAAPAAPCAGPLSGLLQNLHACPAGHATRARGPGTLRTYCSAWHSWEAWCASLSRPPLPGEPGLIAMYAVHCANRGLSVSSPLGVCDRALLLGFAAALRCSELEPVSLCLGDVTPATGLSLRFTPSRSVWRSMPHSLAASAQLTPSSTLAIA